MGKPHTVLVLAALLGLLSGCSLPAPAEETTALAREIVAETTEATAPKVERTPEEVTIAQTYVQVPEGFHEVSSENGTTIYGSPNAEDTSAVVVQILPWADVLSYTEQDLRHSAAVGADGGRVTVNAMEFREIADREGLYGDVAMRRGGRNCRSFCYLIPADQLYSFTFTDSTPDGAWTEAFAEAGKTIALLEEGQFVQVDREKLTRYDLGCGMEIYAGQGMKAEEVQGYNAALLDEDTVILLFSEAKSQVGEGFSLEEYAHAVTSANGLEDCTLDAYGNLGTEFTRQDGQGGTSFYYMTVKETEDAFWLCQITCPEERAIWKAESYHRWSGTLARIG